MLEPAREYGLETEANPGQVLVFSCQGSAGAACDGRAMVEHRCSLGWHLPAAGLFPRLFSPGAGPHSPVCFSASPPCQQTCFVITFLQHWEPFLATSCWIALCYVCHRFGAGFLLLGIPEASLLPAGPAPGGLGPLSSPCNAWHCWENCSCCIVLHVGGLFSLQRSGFYFLHLPSFCTCIFFDAGGCLKLSMLLPACWSLGRAAKGCRGGVQVVLFSLC